MNFSVWPSLLGAAIALVFILGVPLARMSLTTRALRKQNPSAITFPVLMLPAVRDQVAQLQRRLPWAGKLPSRLARPVAVLDDSALTLWNGRIDGQPVLRVPREQITAVELGSVAAFRPVRCLQWSIALAEGVAILDLPVFTATSLVSAVDVARTEILLVDIQDELWPEPLADA